MVVAAVRLSLLTSVNDPLVPSGKVRLVLSGSGEAPSVVTALQLARQVFAPQLLALARQSRAQRTAKRFEAAFRQLLYDAAQVGRRALDPYAIEGKDVDAIVAAAMMAMVREFKALPDLLFAVLTAAGTSAAKASKGGARFARTAFAFNVKDPRAITWAKEHGATRVVEIGRETRKAIASVISRAQADGLSTRQQARLVRPLIGLTERDANAVYNRHETLILEGLDAEEALLEAATYADELLDARARTIARSETSEAAEEGQRQTWEQAVEEGYLPADVQRVWLATPLACPICQDMDGEAVGLDEPWTLPDGEETLNPQAHPNCTCSQGIA